ncbi:Glycosyltransferase involved in cell wall bisynthesis [Prevotellaceae bacterium MN60]|nr:Glycosyltransferase involved in cell wall bisynthesis [Prevotellaceae bacterium MN60]
MIMENTLVSVLMCFYNEKECFLRKSIESILNQTYRNIEFVIIGDCPPNNNLPNVVREYMAKDSRIHYFQNEVNLGLTKSLNKGLSLCKGEYVVRMDADDISLPDRIQKQVCYMDKHPKVFASGGGGYAIDENDNIIRRIEVPTGYKQLLKTSLTTSPLLHPSAILRCNEKSSVSYDENFRYAQDYALWISLMEKDLRSVTNIKAPLIKYRYSSGQIFTKHKEEQQACADRLLKRIEKLYNLIIPEENDKTWKSLLRGRDLCDEQYEPYLEFISNFRKMNSHVSGFIRRYITNLLIVHFLTFEKNSCNKSIISFKYITYSMRECCFNIRYLMLCFMVDLKSI